MSEKSTLLRAVGALKPSERDVSESESRALLEQVNLRISEGATSAEEARRLTPYQPPVATRRLLAGAAATALVAVGAITVSNYDTAPAYAGWTSTPTEIASSDVDVMAQICPPEIPGPGPDAEMIPVSPLLAEERGPYRMMLSLGDGDSYQVCLTLPDEDSSQGYYPVAMGSVPGPGNVTWPAEDDGALLLDAGTYTPPINSDPVTLAVGTAGSDVEALTLHTSEGSFVEATVMDGWWIVWIPGEVSIGDSASVVTSEGTAMDVILESPHT
ncbi:hypothetical protein IM660_07205 [Ruania alkalisoli]|uniref:Uncharacterized protein n=1 Tax=Ruania alkalisoli TaxID=2779775 RepID=A0A7M1SWZ9_9MICO|nr:hypothetical protein [Ruania alkalisoli]QOR72021.1 hypothetical protein IM660_07205 [Ruania alkalisoli]